MNKVFGFYNNNGEKLYIVGENEESAELFKEGDLRLLLHFDTQILDEGGVPLSLSNGNLIVKNATDLTQALKEQIVNESDSYEDDEYSDYDEEVESDDFEDFDEDDIEEVDDDYFDYEEVSSEDEEQDEEEYTEDDYIDLEEVDEDFFGSLDEIDEYYRDWKNNNLSDTSSMGENELEIEEKVKNFDDLEESTESKLYKHLTDDQIKLLQEYYVYISQRVFKLERGNLNLPARRSKDLDSIRATGDSWAYAGFIDMGYAGTSICPFCHRPLSMTALSSCHKAPVVRVGTDKKTGVKMAFRTHNGVCSHPNCRSRCSVVLDSVGTRNIDRSRQMGIICESCGNNIPQSSHYCTFNDPVRYMHVAWDVSVSDLEKNFYGQFATKDIEELIDSNNCIKFGLTCTAEFFDIEKDSSAFKALENVQNVCKKDIQELEEVYEAGQEAIDDINNSFEILDSIIGKLSSLAAKYILLQDDETLPGRLFELYRKMRMERIVIPRSFIQYVRDFLVDWESHKFTDRSKKYPSLVGSVGSVQGSLTGSSAGAKCNDRLSMVVSGIFGRSSEKLCSLIDYYKVYNRPYKSVERFNYAVYNYTVAFFIYELCGYYKYNAITFGDEGGKDQDKDGNGKHATELKAFYHSFKSVLFKDMVFSREYLGVLCNVVTVYNKLHDYLEKNYVNVSMRYNQKSKDGNWYKEYYLEDCSDNSWESRDKRKLSVTYAFNKFDDRLSKELQDGFSVVNADIRHLSTIEWLEKYKEKADYLESIQDSYFEFEQRYMNEQVALKNQEELDKLPKPMTSSMPAPIDDSADKPVNNNSKQSYENVQPELRGLLEADLTRYSFNKQFEFPLQIVDTLRKSGRPATDKQLKYLAPLYEAFTGKKMDFVEPPKPKLELKLYPELSEAIGYVINHPDSTNAKTVAIIQTVLRTGLISERQMKYVEEAKRIFDNVQ